MTLLLPAWLPTSFLRLLNLEISLTKFEIYNKSLTSNIYIDVPFCFGSFKYI